MIARFIVGALAGLMCLGVGLLVFSPTLILGNAHPTEGHQHEHMNSPSCGDLNFVSCSYLVPRPGNYYRHSACDNERDVAWVISETMKANGEIVRVSTKGQGLVCDYDTFYATSEPAKHRLIIDNGARASYRPWSCHNASTGRC